MNMPNGSKLQQGMLKGYLYERMTVSKQPWAPIKGEQGGLYLDEKGTQNRPI